jgi:hypothetical protein
LNWPPGIFFRPPANNINGEAQGGRAIRWRARYFSMLGLLSEGSPCMRTHKNGASGNGMFVTTIVGITRRHKLKSEKLHHKLERPDMFPEKMF